MDKQKIYCISGLGADYRVFELINIPNYELVHLEWIDPLPKEPLTDYAQRLAQKITGEQPIIMGLSFGGIVATEIGKIRPYKHIITLASVRCRREMPWYFKMCKQLPFHRLAPENQWNTTLPLLRWLFGVDAKNEALFSSISSDTNPKFAKWAIDSIVHWNQRDVLPNVSAIHGTKDKIFPARRLQNVNWIKNAGHLMTLTHPVEISTLITQLLEQKYDDLNLPH